MLGNIGTDALEESLGQACNIVHFEDFEQIEGIFGRVPGKTLQVRVIVPSIEPVFVHILHDILCVEQVYPGAGCFFLEPFNLCIFEHRVTIFGQGVNNDVEAVAEDG